MVKRSRGLKAVPYEWIVVALSLMGGTGINFVHGGVPVLFPFIQEDLGVNKSQLGLIISGLLLGGAIAVLPMGWLSDTLGVKRLLRVTLVVLVACVLLFSQFQNLVQGVLLAILIGVLASATGPALVKAIMDWVSPRSRSLAMGIVQTANPTTGIVTAAFLPVLAEAFGWRRAMIALSLTILVSVSFFVGFYRDKPGSGAGLRRSSPIESMILVVRDRNIWLGAIEGMALASQHFVFLTYLVLFLKEDIGLATVVAGLFLALAHVGSAFGRVGWGVVSDLALRGRRVPALFLLGLTAVVTTAIIARLPADTPLVLVAVLVFVAGSAIMGWPGLYNVLMSELAGPRLVGTVFGFTAIARQVTALAVLPLFGLIVDQRGSYEAAWWMMVGIATLGVLVLPLLWSQERWRGRFQPAGLGPGSEGR